MSDCDLLYDYIIESDTEAREKEEAENIKKAEKAEKIKEENELKERIKKRKRNIKLMNGELVYMKINNDIKEICDNYEGFQLKKYGKGLNGQIHDFAYLHQYDIKKLVIEIIAYNPLKDKDIVILSSEDFKNEINSSKLRVDFINEIYKKIINRYLLVENKSNKTNNIISLEDFISEIKEIFIIKDKEVSEKIEKMFKKEYSLISGDKEESEKMTLNLFLNNCRNEYNLNDKGFLDFCYETKNELYPKQKLWLKVLKNLNYQLRDEIVKKL